MSEHPEHQSKQERMREALEFYACRYLYPPFDNSYPSLTEDRGKRVRAALSDVTEQKDLGDCPEPLGQTREDEGRNAL